MELIEVIDIFEQEKNNVLPKGKSTKVNQDFSFDEKIFSKMANFIINLEPENLSDSQLEYVINMIEMLEVENDDIDNEDIKEGEGNPKLAKRSLSTKNQSSKIWYRKNRNKIKKRKERLKRSSQGRKRIISKDRLERQGRTPTGRRNVKYHVRKKSDRRE
jgi:hypothetical protein